MRPILDDLLASIATDAPVTEIRTCVFWTAVCSRDCGLASTYTQKDYHHGGREPVEGPGSLTGKSGKELAALAKSTSLLEATIGMATLNSLLTFYEKRCVELNAWDLLMSKGEGKRVAMVGHFPIVPKLREVAKQLWVLEQQPGEGDIAAEEADKVLQQADVVAITGGTFVNHTIDSTLSLCQPGAFVMVLGPTTPLSPVLFDHGVDVVSGIKVSDSQLVLRCISEGATFRQMKGVRLLTMQK